MSKHTRVFRFVRRVAFLLFFVFLLIGLLFPANINPVKAEGSKELMASGVGSRPLTEWRVDTTAGLYRRTFFRVYANAGENILMGSSAMGLGLGDIVLYQEGQISNSQINQAALAAITPTFRCSVDAPGLGILRGLTSAATRSMELVGATTNGGLDGGYTPCVYTVPAGGTGTYWVAMYGPSGPAPAINTNGSSGTIAAPNITAAQASGVSVWDITVRAGSPLTGTNRPGRVFVDYLAQKTATNGGVANQVYSAVYASTADGYVYQVGLNGLDPFGYILYGNSVGFLDPDGTTPLYHDVQYPDNQLSNPAGGVTLPPASARIFFSNPLLSDLPASILPAPVPPAISNVSYLGSAGGVTGYHSVGGQFTFASNVVGISEVVISLDGLDFQPDTPTNRVLRSQVTVGSNLIDWDGLDNTGVAFPVGNGYKYRLTFHAGEYHFPLLDAENSPNGGPTLTLLNPIGGVCPFNINCHTGFYDDRGYRLSTGAIVGTVGVTLPGDVNGVNPPLTNHSDDINGFDTSTNQRAWGNGTNRGFGNWKALDLWAYIPVGPFEEQLNVVDPNPLMTVVKSQTSIGPYAVNDTITYDIVVTNTGNVTLTGVSVTDSSATIGTCTPAQPSTLALNATMTCPASHVVTQADVDTGGYVNTATGDSDQTPPGDSTVTVNFTQSPALTIVKSVTETTYAAVGTILHYSYLVTNSGNVTLNGPFTVTDDKSTDESCPATASLAPGASITCTATYTITQADIDSGSVTNIASVHGFFGSTPVDSGTDTETVSAAQNPLMIVTKSQTSIGPYAVNDTITYNIVVTNTGNVTLTGVSVTDSSATVGTCTPAQPSTLAPNATMTCPASHVVTQADVNTGSYVNTATGDSDQTPPSDSTVTVNFTQSPAHTIVKSQTSIGPYAVNDTIAYNIVVTNTGNVTLTGVSVTDSSATVGTCTPAQPSTLAPNATMTCPASHVVTQTDVSTGSYVNTATGDSDQTPPGDSTVTVNFTQSPSLTIVKSVTETTYAAVGTILHYSYLVTNSGNVTLNGPFTVTDDKSTDESCPATASLAPGASITCTATYTVTQADIDSGSVTNIASAHGFFGSTPVNSATDTETVNAARNPLMTVVKSSATTNLNAPGTVIYNYLVTNAGNITLTGISLSDDNDNNDMSCPATTLAPTATMTCSATHTFTQAELDANGSPTAGSGFLTNIVTASSNEAQSATDTLDIPIANVDLSLTKTVNNTSPKVGDAVVFTITITNHSLTTAATNVVVDDVLPVGLTFNSATPSLGSFSNVTGDWTIATLAANTSATLLVNVTVTQIGVITNTAEIVAADQFDIDSTPNNHVPTEDDQASVSIGSLFDPPSGIKSFSEAGLPQLEFRMVWINSGNTTTINTQVVDNIPAGTVYVSGSIVCTPLGSSANAIAASVPLNTTVANSFCAFDPINNRIQWQGFIGPDDGNLTEAAAANEVVITFRVTVNDGVNQVVNFGSSRTDTDGDTDFTDETVLGTSLIITNQVVWNRSPVVVDDDPGNTPAPSVASGGGFLIPVTGFAPDVVTKLNTVSGPAYETTNLTIKIPTIKVNTSIVGVEQKDEDWDVSWLQNQAGWLSGTAYPTWKGNSVVTAHVVNADGKPGVFFKLKHLKTGEYIFVYNRGYRYTYKVVSNEFVQPDDISVLKHESKSYLTLITCDTYDEDTDTYLRRVAVRAVLVDVREIK